MSALTCQSPSTVADGPYGDEMLRYGGDRPLDEWRRQESLKVEIGGESRKGTYDFVQQGAKFGGLDPAQPDWPKIGRSQANEGLSPSRGNDVWQGTWVGPGNRMHWFIMPPLDLIPPQSQTCSIPHTLTNHMPCKLVSREQNGKPTLKKSRSIHGQTRGLTQGVVVCIRHRLTTRGRFLARRPIRPLPDLTRDIAQRMLRSLATGTRSGKSGITMRIGRQLPGTPTRNMLVACEKLVVAS